MAFQFVNMAQSVSYVGRFAPSPTGPLHAGSAVAALASWLDARAHQGQWCVRIEDVDTPRCRVEHGETILRQLHALGLHPDGPVWWQSQRCSRYQEVLDSLRNRHLVYACTCSRRDIEEHWLSRGHPAQRHQPWAYPGTCRPPHRAPTDGPHAWRLNVHAWCAEGVTVWHDRWQGAQSSCVAQEVGDFVLKRSDGCWAYQLAVVVDDADQGVTHIVRGADLLDNTARQVLLQQALGVTMPQYAHVRLVLNDQGEKLSKQQGAQALALDSPAASWQVLCAAAQHLGLPLDSNVHEQVPAPGQDWTERLQAWVPVWRRMWVRE